MTSLLMSSPAISISHRLFRCRYSNSRDVIASSPSFSQSAPESLLADYFLRTPSAPITTGVVSISILHLLVLSSKCSYNTTSKLILGPHRSRQIGASSLDSKFFRWCQHPLLPAASETDFTSSSSTASFLYYSGFTGASKSTIIMVWSSPGLFLGILSHVSAAIPQLRDITL